MLELFSFTSTGEIDRCLKKVAEGVEQFEDIWQKVRDPCFLAFAFHVFLWQSEVGENYLCHIFIYILAPQCSQCKPEGKV